MRPSTWNQGIWFGPSLQEQVRLQHVGSFCIRHLAKRGCKHGRRAQNGHWGQIQRHYWWEVHHAAVHTCMRVAWYRADLSVLNCGWYIGACLLCLVPSGILIGALL